MQKERIKRAAALFLAVLLLLCSIPVTCVSALEPPTVERVGAAYLYNIENNKVLFEQDADKQMYPAASVKVMTAVVAYEALRDRMDETVIIEKEMIASAAGNHIAIEAGEHITVRDLFYAMLLKGANDAAYVLAYLSSGSADEFIAEMNRCAAEYGMENTVYTNPTGLHDPDMHTTARDTGAVAERFASHSELVEMSSVSKHVIEKTEHCTARNLYNRNAFVTKWNSLGTKEYYYPDAKGMNFGSTEEGGDSFVTMTEKDGLRNICVILGGEESADESVIYAFLAARALCDYAVGGFGYIKVLSTDRLVYDMPVSLSEETDHVMLVPSEELFAFLPFDVDPERDLTYTHTLAHESLKAPVEEGTMVGYVSVYHGEELLGTSPLVTQNEVRLSEFLSTLEYIKEFSRSKFFICSVISLVVLTVGFVIGNSIYRSRRAGRRKSVRNKKFR